jgi:hypothetical protein
MKSLKIAYYVLLGIGAAVLWAPWLIDLARSGELKGILSDPLFYIVIVGAVAAVGLAFFYLSRRGGPVSENQAGCVIFIALLIVGLVAMVILFFVVMIGGGV